MSFHFEMLTSSHFWILTNRQFKTVTNLHFKILTNCHLKIVTLYLCSSTTGLSTFIKRVNCTTTAEPDWLLKTPSQKFLILGCIEVCTTPPKSAINVSKKCVYRNAPYLFLLLCTLKFNGLYSHKIYQYMKMINLSLMCPQIPFSKWKKRKKTTLIYWTKVWSKPVVWKWWPPVMTQLNFHLPLPPNFLQIFFNFPPISVNWELRNYSNLKLWQSVT